MEDTLYIDRMSDRMRSDCGKRWKKPFVTTVRTCFGYVMAFHTSDDVHNL